MPHDSGGDPIEALLAQAVAAQQLPGAAWRVEREGAVLSEGAVGFASVEPRRVPAGIETPYDLASLTKPLATALLAVDLEARGRLDLMAPVTTWVEELESSPHGKASSLDLGAHRAGLAAWKPLYLEASDLSGFLHAIARTPRAVEPGATLYSDLGYLVLGAVVERAAGSTLVRLFEERIARPLGLGRIGFSTGSTSYPDAAATERGNAYERTLAGASGAGFPWRDSVLRGEVHDGNARALGGVAGHAGLFGTVSEVAAIGRELLHPAGVVPSSRAQQLLLRPVAGAGSRTFGLVPAAQSAAARGALPAASPGHTGFTGTSLWLDLEDQLVMVLLTNRVHPIVPEADFQPLRLEFHRRARALARP